MSRHRLACLATYFHREPRRQRYGIDVKQDRVLRLDLRFGLGGKLLHQFLTQRHFLLQLLVHLLRRGHHFVLIFCAGDRLALAGSLFVEILGTSAAR
jgi:hypothetical protein